MRGSRRLRSFAGAWGPGVIVGLLAVVAYGGTLAPTVLDGDAALFQYLPSVTGIAYPTGYPTYVLLGRLWQMLIPLGTVAWRMNAFSGVCGALSLVFIYRAYAHWLDSRLGGTVTAILFGTLPTFWRWATESKSYTLHILFLALMLYIISLAGRKTDSSVHQSGVSVFFWLVLIFGVSLGNHNTTILLAPGLALLYWLNGGHSHHSSIWQLIIRGIPFIMVPLLLYAFIPVRAGFLLTQWGAIDGLMTPVAVARGLVSDFYTPGPAGLWRYFTAADFTGGVVSNWGLVPRQFVSVYWPLMKEDFSVWGIAWATVGAVTMAAWRPRRFWPLFVVFCVPIPFVLTYGQGEQSAFLLPSMLMVAGFAGAAVAAIWRAMRKIWSARCPQADAVSTPILAAVLLGLAVWLPATQAVENVHWLRDKWSSAHDSYWRDVLAHPIDEGAGLMAHWGDLTTMWYLQHVDEIRPDVYGLFPPSSAAGEQWLNSGHSLYVAGPLQGWGDELLAQYQVVPWGKILRLVPQDVDTAAILPTLDLPPLDAVFGDRVVLQGQSFPRQAQGGQVFPVTLNWESVGPIPLDTSVSLRLVDPHGNIMVQADEALLSGWLPTGTIEAGQRFVSFHSVQMPAGTWPGDLTLEIALFDPENRGWHLQNGDPTVVLGDVQVSPELTTAGSPDPWQEYKPRGDLDFGAEIRLEGYDYSVTRAGQGKGFGADFLWRSLETPSADYTLLVQLVDRASGRVLREWRHSPTDGYLPTSLWQPEQLVRDRVDLVLPADTPPGDDSIIVRLGWLDVGGDLLRMRRWGSIPIGNMASLPGVRVVEKEDRLFDVPTVQHSLNAAFDDKVRLLGYNMPSMEIDSGSAVSLDFIWQSLTSDMDTSYTVFVHLVDSDGQVRAQGDKVPGYRSKQPTTGWVKGEIVVDPISIAVPEDLAPGEYTIRAGLYRAPDGPRLPTIDPSSKIETDAIDVTHLVVNAP